MDWEFLIIQFYQGKRSIKGPGVGPVQVQSFLLTFGLVNKVLFLGTWVELLDLNFGGLNFFNFLFGSSRFTRFPFQIPLVQQGSRKPIG